MRGDNLDDLIDFAPRMVQELKTIPIIADVSSDQQNRGLQSMIQYDRDTAARFGISPQLIDNTLYDAFGQRQVSTMYTALNQYHVVMEAAPEFWQNPLFLQQIYVRSPGGQQVPLERFRQVRSDHRAADGDSPGPVSGGHHFLQSAAGRRAGRCRECHRRGGGQGRASATIQTGFAGTAQAYQDSLGSEPILIAAALVTVYIMLAMLYESYIHPITIISTLPSASVGALLALLLTHTDLSIIAIIGIILLIGIVKKNAIMMIDFALAAERNEGKNSRDSIVEACMLRFRPILMTTMAALLGALPLALGNRHRIRASPSAGNHHHRRIAVEPVADAVHDAGGLSLLRQASALVVWRPQPPASGGRPAYLRGMKNSPLMPASPLDPALRRLGLLIPAMLLSTACMVGPKYQRPAAPPSTGIQRTASRRLEGSAAQRRSHPRKVVGDL